MEEYLKTIEETVIKACAEARVKKGPEDEEPIDSEKLIEEWKVAEKEWLEKVVDIKQHEDLVSPYEPNQEKGVCTDIFTEPNDNVRHRPQFQSNCRPPLEGADGER